MDSPAGAAVSAPLAIIPVDSRRAERDFLDVPLRIHADEAHWVAPLRKVERRRISRRRTHPFYDHGEAKFWVAYRGATAVGRIGALINHLHLEHHHDFTGHFAMFEASDDDDAIAALFRAAEEWVREKGMERLSGPFNLSINEECGLLVDGFESRPAFGLGYAPPRYARSIEKLGYTKEIDLLTFITHGEITGLDEVAPRINRATADAGYRIRLSTRGRIKNDLKSLVELYNDAWSGNWGFIPITEKEAAQLVRDLRPIINPRTFAIAERDGVPAAIFCGIPDINEVLRTMNGRLLPFGWIRLLRWLQARNYSAYRIPLAGVRRELQRSALGGIVQTATAYVSGQAARGGHLDRVEAGWVLENNRGLLRFVELGGMKPHKRYRIYAKDVSPS